MVVDIRRQRTRVASTATAMALDGPNSVMPNVCPAAKPSNTIITQVLAERGAARQGHCA